MLNEIETAIKTLAKKANNLSDSTDALKMTQAVLNLTHAWVTVKLNNG